MPPGSSGDFPYQEVSYKLEIVLQVSNPSIGTGHTEDLLEDDLRPLLHHEVVRSGDAREPCGAARDASVP